MKNEWIKCWKIRCTPPIEVYKDTINFFGSNIDIKNIDKIIKDKQDNVDLLKEAKKIWKEKFNN